MEEVKRWRSYALNPALLEYVTADGRERGTVGASAVQGEYFAEIGPAVYDGFTSLEDAMRFVEENS
jgi:hypothetical protein